MSYEPIPFVPTFYDGSDLTGPFHNARISELNERIAAREITTEEAREMMDQPAPWPDGVS